METYIKNLELKQFFKRLGVSDPEMLAREVEHFTTKEAQKRDTIVINYFGERGINQIVDKVTKVLLAPTKLPAKAKMLDVGAGSGFFIIKIAEKIQAKLPMASLYAMDLTPAMLLSLTKKETSITPFLGVAENIKGSIREARKFFNVPYKFDAAFSTLMLHHSLQPEEVFRNLKEVLKKKGKAIVIDLCAHSFEEFKEEMGDIHLGFKPEDIEKMAKKHFSKVEVEKLSGICCESSGRSADIFAATMKNV